MAQHQRQRATSGGHGGHQDGTEPQNRGLQDGLLGTLALLALGFDGEIDHQDSVLLDDANEQDDPDESDDAQINVEEHQEHHRAHPGGGQRGKDGDGVNVAFIKNPQHDINGQESRDNQERLPRQGGLEGLQRAGKTPVNGGGHAQFLLHRGNIIDRFAQRHAGIQIERDGDGGKLALVVDLDGGGLSAQARHGRERHFPAVGGLKVNGIQPRGRLPPAGRHLHDDIILIERCVHGRDQRLPKGAVERVVQTRCRQAQAHGRRTVIRQSRFQAFILLVGVNVLHAGQFFHVFQQDRPPLDEIIQRVAGNGVLVLGAAHAAADA